MPQTGTATKFSANGRSSARISVRIVIHQRAEHSKFSLPRRSRSWVAHLSRITDLVSPRCVAPTRPRRSKRRIMSCRMMVQPVLLVTQFRKKRVNGNERLRERQNAKQMFHCNPVLEHNPSRIQRMSLRVKSHQNASSDHTKDECRQQNNLERHTRLQDELPASCK